MRNIVESARLRSGVTARSWIHFDYIEVKPVGGDCDPFAIAGGRKGRAWPSALTAHFPFTSPTRPHVAAASYGWSSVPSSPLPQHTQEMCEDSAQPAERTAIRRGSRPRGKQWAGLRGRNRRPRYRAHERRYTSAVVRDCPQSRSKTSSADVRLRFSAFAVSKRRDWLQIGYSRIQNSRKCAMLRAKKDHATLGVVYSSKRRAWDSNPQPHYWGTTFPVWPLTIRLPSVITYTSSFSHGPIARQGPGLSSDVSLATH